jgi:hypothetical protein
LEDGATDEFGDLWDYGVSEGSELLLSQPAGKPIIISENRGDARKRWFQPSKSATV